MTATTSVDARPLETPARPAEGPSRHIAHLDGLRALAVLAILVRHAWGLSGSPHLPVLGLDLRPLMVMLSSGVDLFFVLSGYLLAQSFLRRRQTGAPPPRYADYWRARLLRIGPPYWIILILVVVFMTPSHIDPDRVFSFPGLAIFGAHAVFLQSAYLPSFGAYAVESPFWTLTVEMIFYAALPLMVRAFYGRRWMVSIPVFGAAAVAWLVMVRTSADPLVALVNGPLNVFPPFDEATVRFFLSHQFPAFLLDFALGIGVAALVVSKDHALAGSRWFQRLTGPVPGLVIFLAGCAVVLASMWTLGTLSIAHEYANPINYMTADRPSDLTYYYLETIPFGIGFSMMLAGLVLGPWRLRATFSWKPLTFIGVIGYSVYLIHMPTLYTFNGYPWLAQEFDPSEHFLKLLLAGGAVTLALSVAYHHLVERPAMRAARRQTATAPRAARVNEAAGRDQVADGQR